MHLIGRNVLVVVDQAVPRPGHRLELRGDISVESSHPTEHREHLGVGPRLGQSPGSVMWWPTRNVVSIASCRKRSALP